MNDRNAELQRQWAANHFVTPQAFLHTLRYHRKGKLCIRCHRGNPCTARALRATFRLCSPRRAPRHTPWKRP